MKLPGPDHPITITPNKKRVRIIVGGQTVADTAHALRLQEASYPAVLYIPRADARMDLFTKTSNASHCPYKGDASYYSVAAGAKTAEELPGIAASVTRSDLCKQLGSCDHGFDVPVPLGVRDGKAHQVFAYGANGTATAQLTNAPKSFTCAPPAPPATAVKRLLPSAAVVTAWKISMLTDVARLADAVINALPKGDDLPASPDLAIGDDGAPEVWLLEGGKRRHVVSPASMSAWHFGAPKKTPAAALKAMPQGADWAATPFLVEQGTTPMLYALDTPDAPPGTGTTPPSANGTDPSAHSDGTAVGAPDPAPPSAGGCQLAPARRAGDAPMGGFAAAFALALACVGALRRRGLRAT